MFRIRCLTWPNRVDSCSIFWFHSSTSIVSMDRRSMTISSIFPWPWLSFVLASSSSARAEADGVSWMVSSSMFVKLICLERALFWAWKRLVRGAMSSGPSSTDRWDMLEFVTGSDWIQQSNSNKLACEVVGVIVLQTWPRSRADNHRSSWLTAERLASRCCRFVCRSKGWISEVEFWREIWTDEFGDALNASVTGLSRVVFLAGISCCLAGNCSLLFPGLLDNFDDDFGEIWSRLLKRFAYPFWCFSNAASDDFFGGKIRDA